MRFKLFFLMAFILASALSTYLFSQQSSLSKGVNYLSEFIASDYFLDLKKNYSDLDLVDSIYIRALEFYDYDYEEALLALTFATIPFRKVPLVIPFINVRIYYPLISANDSISNLKNQNLPAKLFYDTPDDSGGDKDKLAHFFGNAFIGYAENVLKLADVFGYFVEAFEEDFKAQSEVDFRDVDVNWYGVLFGDMLELNKKILPSQIMTLRSLRYFIITL
ncbi:MAG: hypothetical protein DAHOPDDO_00890 [Ignavibacteriaceae bacterium]|nr:MAG: hypothetical protein EDM72_06655 [Chlorobiota bacterium]MBL1121351.1 hypothetical protein [Ignavibacteriota bacterium]MBV6419666.1 hypothetical protein [Ignavibacteriaceae bacterium]MCE7855185.1 hypothetical protein [Ignavibacteria bacterium CHB3]GIK60637.1 MAG: hypothetical protein BroJett017_15270 [Ignavibacteriota bacterium]